VRPNEKERVQTYETFVPKITNEGITSTTHGPEETKKPQSKPENDPLVGSIEDRIRVLELENEILRLKLANKSNPEKNDTDLYFQ
jgi:hypothetical protein